MNLRRIFKRTWDVFRAGGKPGVRAVGYGLFEGMSFSQYAEDLFLFRYLALPRRGYYIEIGAAHPVEYSNSYRFYLYGWSGLTIEPNEDLAALHKQMRPRDVCVNIGVSESATPLKYWKFSNPFYNTFDEDVVSVVQKAGVELVGSSIVPTATLKTIMDTHVTAKMIDFMSVDCEGMDLAVLKSSDWVKWRPKAVLVEDHQANMLAITNSPITLFLCDQNYTLVSRLGFTSLYVANEHVDTLPGHDR